MRTNLSLPKVRVKIEIPQHSNIKYEFNKDRQVIEVDRLLDTPMPYNYGFVVDTLWADGDPLDAIVLDDYDFHPGVEMQVTPIAIIKMYDQGESDFKLVCNHRFHSFDKDAKLRQNIVAFLKSYKPGVVLRGVECRHEEIMRLVSKAKADYKDANRARQIMENVIRGMNP